MSEKLSVGSIGWIDLTVPNAAEIKEFYSKVIGWISEDVSMGDYNDYNMTSPETGDPNAGICNNLGINKALPSSWMAYFIIADMTESLKNVKALGGKVIVGPKSIGGQGKIAVIKDPAGAVCALFEQS